MSHLSREIVTLVPIITFNAKFSQFCVGCIDPNITPNITDIFVIPAHTDGELFASGRSGLVCETGIFGDATFIAINRNTGAYLFNAKFSHFALAVFTPI